jgi:hypothetical protein
VRDKRLWVPVALAAAVVVALAGCKSSGMAMSNRGQIIKININSPTDLPNGEVDELKTTISNNGVNKLSTFKVDVELPPELEVLGEHHGPGVTVTDETNGTRHTYHYEVTALNPTAEVELRFSVRTAFGTARETGDMTVTVYQSDLPGGHLVESRRIKLRS